MKSRLLRIFAVALCFFLFLYTLIGCGDDPMVSDSDSEESTGIETSASPHDEDDRKNLSGVTVLSGDRSVEPVSGMLYDEFTKEDGTGLSVDGVGCSLILRGPLSDLPALVRSGEVSVRVPVNGAITQVELVDPEDRSLPRMETTLEALSALSAGEYCVVITVVLSRNCDSEAERNIICYEDVFRLVVEADSSDG